MSKPRTLTSVAGLTLMAAAMLSGAPGAAQAGSASTAAADPVPVISDPLADVFAPALSYDGRYVAHMALRRDVASPAQQVRRADLVGGGSELLNPSIDGGVARGNYSFPPVISSSGARVAFTSTAARLVANDTNGRFDAFARDAATDATFLTSVAFDGDAANGASGMTSLSKNGRYVVFTSTATDVVPGSTTTNSDVYRRDLQTGTTVQVTVRPNGAPSKGPGSSSADVSADGNLVAFNSYNADLLATDDADQETDLYIRNVNTGKTQWLSSGVPAGANPDGVVMSPNGSWISTRWADGSLHLTRVSTGATSSVASDGYALTGAFSGQLGRFVFISAGTPLVRELSTGVDTAINVPAGGVVSAVTISGNGRFAAYDWIPDDGSASRIYRVAL